MSQGAVTLDEIELTTDQQLLAGMSELKGALRETNELLLKTRNQLGDVAHVLRDLTRELRGRGLI